MRDGSILTLSRRRGMIDWMRKVIIFLLKTKKRNRNAKEGDAQLFGESLPRSAGTFSRAGKPCRAPQERFPKRENLAALRGNIFPGGKTLPRSAGTFSQAEKPCRAARQAFNDHMFAAVFAFSPTSGRMRYAPTVFGEILTRNDTIHHRIPNE